MVTLSGFADEISPDLAVQLDTLESLNIKFMELRGVWGKNVLDLTDEELDQVKTALDERGVGVSAVGSPIGKAPIDNDFEAYKERVQRAIDVANKLGSHYIRMFSFYCNDRNTDRDEVMRRIQEMVDMAAAGGVVMLHENEKHIYGETAVQCQDLHQTIMGDAFRATFDPANFVQAGVKPFDEAYPLLKPYIEYFHIKDAMMDGGRVVPAGEGDGQVRELMAAAKETGYDGFLSLEPHLQVAGHSSGFSGPELFATAVKALCTILDDLGIAYN
ncbi:MAG: sugar phosphate isomerase/epimerase [Anaerolineae bacterium]|nr:sugar phosphate isomerase/epimerase [Anaerolineae bacterium]